jgi:hypothetical protein
MGIEGGKRFERRSEVSRHRESGGEIFRGRALEAGRVLDRGSMAEKYITPERLAEVKASPYGENRSAESLLVERLTGVLVESGPEMDPQVKARLRDYVNGLRIAAYPNMRPHEQELIRDIAESTGGWATQVIDPDEIGADIRATWQKFDFKVPEAQSHDVVNESSLDRPRFFWLTGTEPESTEEPLYNGPLAGLLPGEEFTPSVSSQQIEESRVVEAREASEIPIFVTGRNELVEDPEPEIGKKVSIIDLEAAKATTDIAISPRDKTK